MVILFGFAVLLWAAFRGTGMSVFEKTRQLHAHFATVNGLVSGSPVWVGGIEVGHVTRIKFVDVEGAGRIHVTFAIEEEVWPLISNESEVAVNSMGLMGDKFLSVTVRLPGQPPATEGSYLMISPASDISAVFAETPELMSHLTETTGRLNNILARVERGEGYLGQLTTDGRSSAEIDSLVRSSRRLMTDLDQSQRRLVAAIERAAESFDSLAQGILHGDGTLSRLVWDTSLYANLNGVTVRADALLNNWETGDGTMGRLSSDSAMYVEVRDLVGDTRSLIDDIMANPRKYFKFSVF
jgi:phospholipid/cholesterol/gamma-HCH transport system substrate-binding protein